jgi:ADP-ribose pyrophosphatase
MRRPDDGRTMEPWPVVDSWVEWETEFFDAGVDLVERPDGTTGRYYWIDAPDSVTVVALLDGEGGDARAVVLVEQYRPRLREWLLECPGGGIDDGESVASAAARELREETGFRAGTVEPLTATRSSAWLRQTHHAVVATDLDPGAADPEDGEFLAVTVLPVARAFERVRRRPTAGWTLSALFAAREAGYL